MGLSLGVEKLGVRLGPTWMSYKSREPLRGGRPEDMEPSRVAGALGPLSHLLLLCIKTLADQAEDTCPGEADPKLVTVLTGHIEGPGLSPPHASSKGLPTLHFVLR